MALQLNAAVGPKTVARVKNISPDVQLVQALLKRSASLLSDTRFAPITVDGRMDDSTLAAITNFQTFHLKSKSPDGVVDKIPKSDNTLGVLISTAMKVDDLKIRIKRTEQHSRSIIGELYVNGTFICYTLELPWKKNEENVSCIPSGTYDAYLRYNSEKASREWVTELLNVPKRTAIQIHIGNYPRDIDGCTLVGLSTSDNYVGPSTAAFQLLQDSIFGEGFTRMQIRLARPSFKSIKVTYDYDKSKSWELGAGEMLA